MQRYRTKLAALAAMLLPGVASASEGEAWIGASAGGSIGGRWQASLDIVGRFDGDGLYEWVASGAIGYRFDARAALSAGYVRKTAFALGRSTIEQRVRQDLTFDDVVRLGPIRVGTRLRAEQRWRQDTAGLGWRVRPQIRLTLPLRQRGPMIVAAVEPFLNFDNHAGQRSGYDRIRESVGVQLPVAARWRADIGYLRQWTRGSATVGATTLGLNYRW